MDIQDGEHSSVSCEYVIAYVYTHTHTHTQTHTYTETHTRAHKHIHTNTHTAVYFWEIITPIVYIFTITGHEICVVILINLITG